MKKSEEFDIVLKSGDGESFSWLREGEGIISCWHTCPLTEQGLAFIKKLLLDVLEDLSVISLEKVRRFDPQGHVFDNASATSSLALAAFLRIPPHVKIELDVFLLVSDISV